MNLFCINLIDIVIAAVIDWIIGDPYWFPHPVIFIGKLISRLENSGRKKFNNDKSLKYYGGFIVVSVVLVSFFIPFLILYIFRNNFYIFHILNIALLCTTFAAKGLKDEAEKVFYAIKKNDINDARLKLSYIVGRDTKNLNINEIIRADVETVAENTSDGIIAPMIYGIIGGAPLAMMYKGINSMDSMLGYMNEKYINIGFFPAKTDDVFNFIPARICGTLICFSAPVVKGNIIHSIKIMLRDRKNHKSPNCAYPEAASAGAMKVQLGGTNIYFGQEVYKPAIGDKINELKNENIIDVIKLMYACEALLVLICIILILCVWWW